MSRYLGRPMGEPESLYRRGLRVSAGKEPGKIWMITVAGFAASLPRLCQRQSAAMLMSTGPGDKSPRRYVYVGVGGH